MNDKTVTFKFGPGFLGCLTLLFVTLKLMGYITWSWIWVLSPLWLPWVAMLSLLLCFGLIGLIGALIVVTADAVIPTRIKK